MLTVEKVCGAAFGRGYIALNWVRGRGWRDFLHFTQLLSRLQLKSRSSRCFCSLYSSSANIVVQPEWIQELIKGGVAPCSSNHKCEEWLEPPGQQRILGSRAGQVHKGQGAGGDLSPADLWRGQAELLLPHSSQSCGELGLTKTVAVTDSFFRCLRINA